MKRSNYNSDFFLFEAGYGAMEARLLSVVSSSYRGADTGGMCGLILLVSTDPTVGPACYSRGDKGSRGTLLADLSYRIDLDPRTTLNLHLGPGGHPNSPIHGHLKLPHPDRASMRR